MPLTVWIAAGMVVGAVPLVIWSLQSGNRTLPAVRDNLRSVPAIGMKQPVASGRQSSTVDGVARLGRRLSSDSQLSHLERRLLAAGLDRRWSLERILALKVVLASAAAAVGLLRFLGTGQLSWLLFGILAGAGLYWVPDLQIGGKARERERAIELQLPDIIDQITVTVEAGLGFDSALRKVTQSTDGPLVDEFRRVLQDIHMGFSRNEALEALAERTEVQDLRLFTAAVSQAGTYGISVADVLRTQSAELREKRKFRAEEQAQKIPVKIVMPLVLCILPVLFIVLLGPAILRIAGTDFGG